MCFPERVKPFFMKFLSVCKKEDITEIRMRADSLMSVTYSGKNVVSFGGKYILMKRSLKISFQSFAKNRYIHTAKH